MDREEEEETFSLYECSVYRLLYAVYCTYTTNSSLLLLQRVYVLFSLADWFVRFCMLRNPKREIEKEGGGGGG